MSAKATHHVCRLALVLAAAPRLGREAEGPLGCPIAMLTLDGSIAAYFFLTSS